VRVPRSTARRNADDSNTGYGIGRLPDDATVGATADGGACLVPDEHASNEQAIALEPTYHAPTALEHR